MSCKKKHFKKPWQDPRTVLISGGCLLLFLFKTNQEQEESIVLKKAIAGSNKKKVGITTIVGSGGPLGHSKKHNI